MASKMPEFGEDEEVLEFGSCTLVNKKSYQG